MQIFHHFAFNASVSTKFPVQRQSPMSEKF